MTNMKRVTISFSKESEEAIRKTRAIEAFEKMSTAKIVNYLVLKGYQQELSERSSANA